MAIGDVFSASVEKIALGGEGMALYEGKVVFIPLTAPGDVVEARITEDRDTWARAELCEVLEAGPGRITPLCPLYGECGGCTLQHLSYNAQLEAKKAILAEATGRNSGEANATAPPPITVIPSNPWEYRNRVSLHAIRSNRFPRCAFKAAKSGALVPVEDCPICDPGIRRVLPGLLPPPGKDRFTLYSKDKTLLAETGTGLQEGKDQTHSSFPTRGKITVNQKEMALDASCFFQANAVALESLLAQITASLANALPANNGRMADLYAGVGTFSLFLSELFPGGSDLLEADSKAMELAKANLTGQAAFGKTQLADSSLIKYRFFAQKDQQWIKKNDISAYSAAVADPPRQGLGSALAAALAEKGPPVLVYVSCEPSSFARDYQKLLRRYALTELFLFDFYPQTAHIECMGTFVQK
jgi:23S rRNA (uracil1939-C5)-methyltransferase